MRPLRRTFFVRFIVLCGCVLGAVWFWRLARKSSPPASPAIAEKTVTRPLAAVAPPLLIKGGTVITAEGRRRADVRTADGLIREVGPELAPHGEQVLNAEGLWVLPGGVDPHVHVTDSPDVDVEYRTGETFFRVSQAAFFGGVTSVGNITYANQGEPLPDAVIRLARHVEEDAAADVFFHMVVNDPEVAKPQTLQALVQLGVPSLKIFMQRPEFDASSLAYARLVAAAGRAQMVVLVHCEDAGGLELAFESLWARDGGSIENFPMSRPLGAETAAVERALAWGEVSHTPLYVVHLSSARALDTVVRGRARGLTVYAEARPLYLVFSQEKYAEAGGGRFVAQPPLRSPADIEALWMGLSQGSLNVLGSDHMGWDVQRKMKHETFWWVPPGTPDVGLALPLLFSEGVSKGRLSAERFVALTSTEPARIFGLYPQKGAVQPGSDADLVLWDPVRKQTVGGKILPPGADFSPYEGMTLTGWPRITLRRGEVVFRDGEVKAPRGSGRFLRRFNTQAHSERVP